MVCCRFTLIFFIGNNVRVKNIEIIEDVIKNLLTPKSSSSGITGRWKIHTLQILLDDFFLMCRRVRRTISQTYMESLAQIKSHGRKAAFYNKPILNIIPAKSSWLYFKTLTRQFQIDVFLKGIGGLGMAETAIAVLTKNQVLFEAGEESGEGEQYK